MKYLIAAVIIIVVIAAVILLRPLDAFAEPSLSSIERVETPADREKGLSGRIEVPDDYGMLFVFSQKGNYSFWMKDMQVPIDIIWLSGSYKILGIEHGVTPESYPETFSPPEPVRYVLETRAGLAEARGWTVGTKLHLPQ